MTLDYKWTVLSNTTLGVLMSSLDSNIVLIALPSIAKDLPGTTLFDLIWILMGYQLITASVVINFGRLADIFGRVCSLYLWFRAFYLWISPMWICRYSFRTNFIPNGASYWGIFFFANSAAILTDAFPPNERGKALDTNQMALVVGSVLGLVFGGNYNFNFRMAMDFSRQYPHWDLCYFVVSL